MTNIIFGLGAVVVGFILYWLYQTTKALIDPDVRIASELRIPINRYRLYKTLYNEYQAFMATHGANSLASERKFAEIFKQIKHPDEWRRYQNYRAQSVSICDLMKEYSRK